MRKMLALTIVACVPAVLGAPPQDAHSKLKDGTTALHYAAHEGDLELARRLIKEGADVNARNDYGSTPMQEAAERGDAALIDLLLKSKASAESANDEGETALMTVARTGNVEAAKAIVDPYVSGEKKSLVHLDEIKARLAPFARSTMVYQVRL